MIVAKDVMHLGQHERHRLLFDILAERYEECFGASPGGIRACDALRATVPAGGAILDLGCGTGVPVARTLAQAGYRVTGIDASLQMLQLARVNVPTGRFLQMRIEDLPRCGMRYDAVVALLSLLFLRKRQIEGVLQAVYSLLCDDGVFCVSMVEGNADQLRVPVQFRAMDSGLECVVEGAYFDVAQYCEHHLVLALKRAGFAILSLVRDAVEVPPTGHVETQLFVVARKRPLRRLGPHT